MAVGTIRRLGNGPVEYVVTIYADAAAAKAAEALTDQSRLLKNSANMLYGEHVVTVTVVDTTIPAP